MKSVKKVVLVFAATCALTACDNSDSVGSSIINDNIEIITDDNFTITGHTVKNSKIQSRTIVQLLGSFNAGEYGTFYSDFVTQFMPASKIETEGVEIDGLTLRMAVPKTTGYVGDTIVPMGLEVYELTHQLEYPIYSDFGNKVSEYYDHTNPIASTTYNLDSDGLTDDEKSLSYFEIPVELPTELGKRLYNYYLDNKDNYLDPQRFAELFPGLYVKSSYGNGRVVKIGATVMTLSYHIDGKTDEGNDTTYVYEGAYYAVSPEIITNNNIDYIMSDELEQQYALGENLLVAPIGLDIEIEFPINDILNSYLNNAGNLAVINSLNFTLPVEEIENAYNITPPPYILMVRTDKKDEFFSKNQITDNLTSFLGTYDATTHSYVFPDMRGYLADRVSNGPASQGEFNFTLTPVTVNTESNSSGYYYGTTTTISSIVPYVETPTMVKILLDKAKISLRYSKQTLKM